MKNKLSLSGHEALSFIEDLFSINPANGVTQEDLLHIINKHVSAQNKDDALGVINKIKSMINENCETLAESYNKSIEVVKEISSMISPNDTSDLPPLRGGDNSNLFDLLLSYKVMTKPEYKNIVLLANKKKGERLKKADEPVQIGLAYLNFGHSYHNTPRMNAFSTCIEYKIIKATAKEFSLPDFKNAFDFDTAYQSDDFMESIFEKDSLLAYLLRHDNVITNEHACQQIIYYIWLLEQALETQQELSDKQYDLVNLTVFIISKMFSELVDLNLIIKTLDLRHFGKIFQTIHKDESFLKYDKIIFKDEDISEMVKNIVKLSSLLNLTSNPNSSTNNALTVINTYRNSCNNILDTLTLCLKISSDKDIINKHIYDESIAKINGAIKVIQLDDLLKNLGKDSILSEDDLLKVQGLIESIQKELGKLTTIEREELINSSSEVDEINENITFLGELNFAKTLSLIKFKNTIAINELQANNHTSALEQMNAIVELKNDITNSLVKEISSILSQTKSTIHKLETSIAQKEPTVEQTQISEMIKKISDLKDENQCLRQDLELHYNTNNELKDSLAKIQQKNTAIEAKLLGFTKKAADEIKGFSNPEINMMTGEANCKDVIQVLAQKYPYIVLSDTIEKNLEKCHYQYPVKLFKILNLLANQYYNAINNGKPDSQAKSIIEPHYRANESTTTMQNSRLKAMRKFTFEGEEYTFEKHLTIGDIRDQTKTVQVYFDIINHNLMIGYIGAHLEISSS